MYVRLYVQGVWADLKKIADVWKSQPSLNDFDAGALRAGGNFWLSPVTGLPAQICWPRPELRDRLRFTAVSSIFILQAFAWAGIVRSVCIPTQSTKSILGGPGHLVIGELSASRILSDFRRLFFS